MIETPSETIVAPALNPSFRPLIQQFMNILEILGSPLTAYETKAKLIGTTTSRERSDNSIRSHCGNLT